LERVELLLRLERELCVKLPDHLLSQAESVSDLVRAVTAVRSQRTSAESPSPLTHTVEAGAPHPTEEFRTAPGGVEVWAEEGGWPSTLDEAVFHFARREPQRVHIHLRLENDRIRTISYGELLAESSAVAAALVERVGLRPQDRVALMLPTGRDFFFAFFGIILAGGVPVPLYPPWRANRIEEYAQRQAKILRDAGARLLVTFQEIKHLMRLLQVQIPSLEKVLTLGGLGKASGSVRRPLPEDASLIQYTSGSTGDGKDQKKKGKKEKKKNKDKL
jgi:non-ribosomal peptide synthetase component E (peptide arylation enzyme)